MRKLKSIILYQDFPRVHYCLVPGCTDSQIKASENKFSNGQQHIKRHHPEFIPFSTWTKEMLTTREFFGEENSSRLGQREKHLSVVAVLSIPPKNNKHSLLYIPQEQQLKLGLKEEGLVMHQFVLHQCAKKTEEEIALEGLSKGLSLSEVNALREEIRAYILLVKDMDIEDRCTLGFFKIHEHKFPLLAKVARRLLCSSGSSCDVERLFSHAGLIYSALRSRLAPRTVQCLTTFHYYYTEASSTSCSSTSRRETAAESRAKRFATPYH